MDINCGRCLCEILFLNIPVLTGYMCEACYTVNTVRRLQHVN